MVTKKGKDEVVYESKESVKEDSDSLKFLIDAAMQMEPYEIRDKELLNVVGAALRKDRYGEAADIIDRIYSYKTQNNAYGQIVDHALSNEKFEIALSAAESISVSRIRNEEIQKILALRTEKLENP